MSIFSASVRFPHSYQGPYGGDYVFSIFSFIMRAGWDVYICIHIGCPIIVTLMGNMENVTWRRNRSLIFHVVYIFFQANRLLAIGPERIVLLDSKTRLLNKSQHTSDLQQWQTGGGRSRDRLVLEFHGTKWSFLTPSQSSLKSIGFCLWEMMQQIDTKFIEENILQTNSSESFKNGTSTLSCAITSTFSSWAWITYIFVK